MFTLYEVDYIVCYINFIFSFNWNKNTYWNKGKYCEVLWIIHAMLTYLKN